MQQIAVASGHYVCADTQAQSRVERNAHSPGGVRPPGTLYDEAAVVLTLTLPEIIRTAASRTSASSLEIEALRAEVSRLAHELVRTQAELASVGSVAAGLAQLLRETRQEATQ